MKQVAVVGLGESAAEFQHNMFSIGVNDVQGTDAVVCVDRMKAFTLDRRQAIIFSPAKKFFSHLEDWSFKSGFNKLKLKNINAIKTINEIETPSSNNSPFVACAVAFQFFRPREILLFGADFQTHKVLSDDSLFQTVLKDFLLLQSMLKKNNCRIVVASEKSRLFNKLL